MIALSEFRQSRWLIAAGCLLLLAGCKAPKPKATTPLWETVDVGIHNQSMYHHTIDSHGDSWQPVTNPTDGHSLRLVDNGGIEQWRISLPSPVSGMKQSGNAMVVLFADGSVRKISADGNVQWQHHSLPGLSSPYLNVSASGHVQVAGITGGDTVHAQVIDDSGALVWQLEQPLASNNNSASLVQAADDRWLLLTSGSYTTIHLFSVSASGVTSELDVIPELQAASWSTLEGDQQLVYVKTFSTLTALNADGSLAWQYQPNRLQATDMSCLPPTADSIVCAHWPSNILNNDLIKQTVVARIALDGSVIQNDLYPIASLKPVASTADGRVVLKTTVWKDLTVNEATVYSYLGGYINYSTTKVFVADSTGVSSSAIVLPPVERELSLLIYPPYVAVNWNQTAAPYRSAIALGLTDDNNLIVSGILIQSFDADANLRPRNNFVTAYAVQ